ncbi:hypothetical protein K438DRAFT_1776807 [Mycena galopus ATCC 62051]|nr:hypothetical protein K438DRAFT_1776807 [Mycena galopus ATCC 62051]
MFMMRVSGPITIFMNKPWNWCYFVLYTASPTPYKLSKAIRWVYHRNSPLRAFALVPEERGAAKSVSIGSKQQHQLGGLRAEQEPEDYEKLLKKLLIAFRRPNLRNYQRWVNSMSQNGKCKPENQNAVISIELTLGVQKSVRIELIRMGSIEGLIMDHGLEKLRPSSQKVNCQSYQILGRTIVPGRLSTSSK